MDSHVLEQLLQCREEGTPSAMLPPYLRQGGNSRQLKYLIDVLPLVVEECLSPEEQQVLDWVFVQQQSKHKLAETLQISPCTITRRYQRAMAEVGKQLRIFYRIAQREEAEQAGFFC